MSLRVRPLLAVNVDYVCSLGWLTVQFALLFVSDFSCTCMLWSPACVSSINVYDWLFQCKFLAIVSLPRRRSSYDLTRNCLSELVAFVLVILVSYATWLRTPFGQSASPAMYAHLPKGPPVIGQSFLVLHNSARGHPWFKVSSFCTMTALVHGCYTYVTVVHHVTTKYCQWTTKLSVRLSIRPQESSNIGESPQTIGHKRNMAFIRLPLPQVQRVVGQRPS